MKAEALHAAYKGKKVFITGHTGFKGAWLLQWLHLLGARVKGYALAPQHENDLFNLIHGDTLCHSLIADVTDTEQLTEALLEFQPDYVFHLAAQPLVRLSYEVPAYTFSVNAMGTVHLLEAVRRLEKPCAVVLITTDKVYENREWLYPYRETDPLGGYDPYSASKACAEIIIDSYVRSFFNPSQYPQHRKAIASARAGNVIGGGDWSKDRIIPDIVRALLQHAPVVVRNPKSVRPWQHVLEPLGGYLELGSRLAADPSVGGAWNFGPLLHDNRAVEDLVQTALQVWGKGSYQVPDTGAQPHEASLLKLDISKVTNALGWLPRYDSETAIKKTMAWYKCFEENKNAVKAFTIDQVKEYAGL